MDVISGREVRIPSGDLSLEPQHDLLGVAGIQAVGEHGGRRTEHVTWIEGPTRWVPIPRVFGPRPSPSLCYRRTEGAFEAVPGT